MSSCHTDIESPAYPLQRDAAEHERLDAQARFWSPDAEALFEIAGVARGSHVADLGNGTLHIPLLLAERVGAHGTVRAVDSDAALVQRMSALARALCNPGVSVLHGDAWATGWQDASLDAVHARFLAAPAGRLPQLAAEMKRLLRREGLALLQEPDASSWHVPGMAWPRLRELIRAGFRARGGDFDAGTHASDALRSAGFRAVQERRAVRVLPCGDPYAALPVAFARQLRPLWLREGLATEAEIDSLVDGVIEALREDGTSTTFTLVQAWGRR